ncbi:MAG: tRNA (adenosine(37)-N6)-dimethylallyltransferase MiaA [Planctomycetaceae bacterium]|nr:tRNA (adenosine(37)-N6)-dimethylallyltransferase MiaA [Planctomycetaceae bacterium]
MPCDPSIFRSCWILAGPTAVGKTALSLQLAQKLDAEILSLDSMAIYRGMDIGTAKPNAEEQALVPHHLIDIVDPHETFSTADYLERAGDQVREIEARGKRALFVGGTGLYLRSILRGVFAGPDADWELRNQLARQVQAEPGSLHRQLAEVDAELARKLHPNDERRIIRGLEVFQLTGKPLSKQQLQGALPPEQRASRVFWLHRDREDLYERINLRVDLMIEQGLMQEVKTLLTRQPPISHTALQGLGYKEAVDYLQGKQDLAATIKEIKLRSRQFAKRQHTWFRNLEECQEIPVEQMSSPGNLVEQILKLSGETP